VFVCVCVFEVLPVAEVGVAQLFQLPHLDCVCVCVCVWRRWGDICCSCHIWIVCMCVAVVG
jgi:hypothetical protein